MIRYWLISLFPKQLNSTVNSLLSFVREDRIYFPSINQVSVVYYVQDGIKFSHILKMDYFCLTPFQKSPVYKCDSINPWITYILNSICSSSLPLSKRMEKNQKMFQLFQRLPVGSKASSKEWVRKLGLLCPEKEMTEMGI